MKRTAFVLFALALAAGALQAQSAGRGPTGQMLYPAKGQTAQQAERDRFECHEWARQQSGFDPTQMAMTVPPAAADAKPADPTSGLVAGAAGGAAIAELSSKDAGKGAAVGVLGAGLRQQIQQHKAMSGQQQQQRQLQAARAQQRGAYDRGFAACMEARGYVVK